MRTFSGVRGSLIIDDTYNASPEAVVAALDTLYEVPSKQKIAVLGQMNELGSFSESLHEQVGKHCDPKKLQLLVTVGNDANTYLADAAEKRGCKVMRCPTAYHAADVVLPLLKKGSVLLVKGSEGGIFLEEAVKELLENADDAKQLVRQSRTWMNIKEKQLSEQ
jgi:UDP-N-acetylmuramoyl-tripeptide--D-alanyl-D-alanine ligase